MIADVPKPARILGLAGAIPFVGLALIGLSGLGADAWVLSALLGYGATILSFMGGIHWGLAMAQNDPSWERLGASVIPALVGWLALLLGGGTGLVLLAAAFAALLLYDLREVAARRAPDWYPSLRRLLTGLVCLSLIVAAIAG